MPLIKTVKTIKTDNVDETEKTSVKLLKLKPESKKIFFRNRKENRIEENRKEIKIL